MVESLIAGIVTILSVLVPFIVKGLQDAKAERNTATKALVGEDIDALKRQLAVGGMPASQPVLARPAPGPAGPQPSQH